MMVIKYDNMVRYISPTNVIAEATGMLKGTRLTRVWDTGLTIACGEEDATEVSVLTSILARFCIAKETEMRRRALSTAGRIMVLKAFSLRASTA